MQAIILSNSAARPADSRAPLGKKGFSSRHHRPTMAERAWAIVTGGEPASPLSKMCARRMTIGASAPARERAASPSAERRRCGAHAACRATIGRSPICTPPPFSPLQHRNASFLDRAACLPPFAKSASAVARKTQVITRSSSLQHHRHHTIAPPIAPPVAPPIAAPHRQATAASATRCAASWWRRATRWYSPRATPRQVRHRGARGAVPGEGAAGSSERLEQRHSKGPVAKATASPKDL